MTEGQHHFEQSENIIVRLRTQMNEVALRANDVLRNDVMLRINDVALRANGMKPFAWCAEILLIFSLKYGIMKLERWCYRERR